MAKERSNNKRVKKRIFRGVLRKEEYVYLQRG